MIRSTTPIHEFEFPDPVNEYAGVNIVYVQSGEIILRKTEDDLEINGRYARLQLTQEETNMFRPGHEVHVQCRVFTEGGDSFPSSVARLRVNDVLNDEVMV